MELETVFSYLLADIAHGNFTVETNPVTDAPAQSDVYVEKSASPQDPELPGKKIDGNKHIFLLDNLLNTRYFSIKILNTHRTFFIYFCFIPCIEIK